MEDMERNITKVTDDDKEFIKRLTSLPTDKKMLLKGVMIGMDLQKKPQATGTR